MTRALADTTRRELDRIAVQAQRDCRTPGLVGAVAGRGDLLWHVGVGAADLSDPSVPLGPDTQFLIASNTKTFTAAMVMQLRDAGRLDLDDTVERHLPGARAAGVTIRQLLAHVSGMQREPVGDVWDSLEMPGEDRVLETWNAAERILRPHHRWHYSNLGYMVLGAIVAELDGRAWAESLRVRLLEPLGLTRTTLSLQAPATRQYYLPPYSDVPVDEPVIVQGGMAPAGGLASTAADLAAWHGFLLDPDPAILSPDSVEEMRQPQIVTDDAWSGTWGLGFHLVRRDGRTWFGHTGGLPGAITGVFSDPESRTTGLVLMNNSSATAPDATAIRLAAHVLEHDPEPLEPWTPGTEAPAELLPLVGLWFSEGSPFEFRIRRGRLEAVIPGRDAAPSEFEREGDDVYRTVRGRERGERLVVRRREDGSVRQLNWATYRFTRQPLGFGEHVD